MCYGIVTEGIARCPDHMAEVSRGHNRQVQSVHSIGTLARKGRNGRARRTGNDLLKARTVWGIRRAQTS